MLIFLDIDGVLNTAESHDLWPCNPRETVDHIRLDQKSVHNFNTLISSAPCKIVISSSWKNTLSLDLIRRIFETNGISTTPVDTTPRIDPMERGEEILEWLRKNPQEAQEPYLVIDDEISDISPHIPMENLLHVEGGRSTGFTREHLQLGLEKIQQLRNEERVA